MVRKRAGSDKARRNRRHPHIRHTTKIDSRGQGAIGFCPGKARRVRVQISPDVNHTAGVEKGSKADGTLTAVVKGVRPTTILEPIKNSVEVTHKKGGD